MSVPTSKSRTGTSSSRSKSRGGKRESQRELTPAENEVPQLAWQILSKEKMSQLAGLPIRQVARELAGVLSLCNYEEDLREAAILDYYVAGYWFARESKFTEEQTSALFTLLHTLLSGLKERKLSLAGSVQELQQHMVGVGLSEQSSLRCLSKEKGQQVVEYIAGSLFQHYHLFEYLFSEEQQQDHISSRLEVSLPPCKDSLCPAPLEEAVPEEFYQRVMAPPPPLSPLTPLSQDTETVGPGTIAAEPEGVPDSSTAADIRLHVTPEEVKSMMETMAAKAFSSYKDQLSLKLKNREEVYTSKLTRIGK